MDNFKTIARWIAVLPASVTGMIAGNLLGILWGLINGNGYYGSAGYNIIDLGEIAVFVAQNAISGFFFVAAGWQVAPSHKDVVKIVLATILGCLVTVNIVLAIIQDMEWNMYVGALITIVGGIVAAYGLGREVKKNGYDNY